MKNFINDCLLFKDKDKEAMIIGIMSWLSIIGLLGMAIWIFIVRG